MYMEVIKMKRLVKSEQNHCNTIQAYASCSCSCACKCGFLNPAYFGTSSRTKKSTKNLTNAVG